MSQSTSKGIKSVVAHNRDPRYLRPTYTYNDDSDVSIDDEHASQISIGFSADHSCEVCQKNFSTAHGLKIHFGRMHSISNLTRKNSQSINSPTLQNSQPNNASLHQKFQGEHLELFENLKKKLTEAKSNIRVLNRIPKGARFAVADKLCAIIRNCIHKNTIEAWSNFLLFSYMTLNTDQNKNKSLTSKIKANIVKFSLPSAKPRNFTNKSSLSKRIEIKIEAFDLKGAVRILSSNDTLAPFNENTVSILHEKHPACNQNLNFPQEPLADMASLCVNEQSVREAILSFPNGSAGGIDGMKPQFLKDLISISAGEASTRLLKALTDLCNFSLSGKVSSKVCPLIYGASLFALTKKDGGVRPIAVGNCLRRLTSKLVAKYAHNEILDYLSPTQLGVNVKQGCESSVHAIRTYVNNPDNRNKVLLKIDFANAFNTIHRQAMLQEVKEKIPLTYPFIDQCYRNPSLLFFGNDVIDSERGCQQGDPCGPMLFSLTVQPIVQKIYTELNSWYLDDATLADSPDIVLDNFSKIIRLARNVGLEVNPSKCEIHFCSHVTDSNLIEKFNELSPGIRVIEKSELNLLGAPIYDEGFIQHATPKLDQLKLMFERLENLNAHVGYTLLKNCLLVPKLTYLLRTSPCWKFEDFLNSVDEIIHQALQSILNVPFDESQWRLATLPIRNGGIGIRKISEIALPAFLSSIHGVQNLVSQILKMDNEVSVFLKSAAIEKWNNQCEMLPDVHNLSNQNIWDSNYLKNVIENFNFSTPIEKARFLALQNKESGCWLHAYPSVNIGTYMENLTFRTCIGLRLGCNLLEKHMCDCGVLITEDGLHSLSCHKGKGRYPRHAELNNIVHRALCSIRVPSTLEPVGLSRDDGKRPDGMTMVPWTKGQSLVWDVTCVNTLADSYLSTTSKIAGSAAEEAARKKKKKYESITRKNYLFLPLAVETLGPWSLETSNFIKTVGQRLANISGDKKAAEHLRHRMSLAIQRGNAASILSTLKSLHDELEEIFDL